LKDLESVEPEFHSSLQWILDNDPEPLDLTFVVEEEAFGEVCACACVCVTVTCACVCVLGLNVICEVVESTHTVFLALL